MMDRICTGVNENGHTVLSLLAGRHKDGAIDCIRNCMNASDALLDVWQRIPLDEAIKLLLECDMVDHNAKGSRRKYTAFVRRRMRIRRRSKDVAGQVEHVPWFPQRVRRLLGLTSVAGLCQRSLMCSREFVETRSRFTIFQL